MENETIEEAVAFIETATGNIKKELKRDVPRDGVTLGDLIQLLNDGKSIKLAIPMNGRYWETSVIVSTRFRNGRSFNTIGSLQDPSVVLSRKVKRIKADNDGHLWVYLEEDK